MMMKRLFFSLILFGFLSTSAQSEEMITCVQLDSKNLSEIMSLITTVKNDMLGTVPKFCREKGADQLAEQVNPKEQALDNFVKELTKLELPNKDAVAINDGRIKDITFQVIQSSILKRMWDSSSESIRYKVLISSSCSQIGFNRLPLSSKTSAFPKEKVETIGDVKKVCMADNFSDLAPYITKDVIAETLFSMKQILPQSFPNVVRSLCSQLEASTDILLREASTDLGNENISIDSVKAFSSWLKDVYEEAHNDESDDKMSAAQIEMHVKLQRKLEKIYNKKDSQLIFLYSGAIVKKNKNGIYTLELTEAEKKKAMADQKIRIKKDLEENLESLENSVNNLQNSMKIYYEKNISPGSAGEPLAVKEFPGYYIVKRDNGTYAFKIDDAVKKEMQKLGTAFLNTPLKEGGSLNHLVRKDLYKKQELGLFDLAELKYYPEKIIKNKEGQYVKYNQDELEKNSNKVIKTAEDLMKSMTVDNEYVPLPAFLGTEMIFLQKQVGLGRGRESDMKNIIASSSSDSAREGQSISFKKYEREAYQEQRALKDSLQNLTAEESELIESYTGSNFRKLNTCLRNGTCKGKDLEEVNALKSAISKIRAKSGSGEKIIFRGVSSFPIEIREALQKNSKNFILDKAFMSFSGDYQVANGFAGFGAGGNILILKTKSCIGMASLSKAKGEDEFLCPPGLKFNIKKIEQNTSGMNHYLLEEVP